MQRINVGFIDQGGFVHVGAADTDTAVAAKFVEHASAFGHKAASDGPLAYVKVHGEVDAARTALAAAMLARAEGTEVTAMSSDDARQEFDPAGGVGWDVAFVFGKHESLNSYLSKYEVASRS